MADAPLLAPLEIAPRPSRWLALFVCASHGIAAAVGLALAADGWYRAGLLALILLSLAYLLWARVWLRAPWSIRQARWDALGWQVAFASGRTADARLLPTSFVGVRLVILHFALGRWRRGALVLSVGAVDADLLRRLRARLRLVGS